MGYPRCGRRGQDLGRVGPKGGVERAIRCPQGSPGVTLASGTADFDPESGSPVFGLPWAHPRKGEAKTRLLVTHPLFHPMCGERVPLAPLRSRFDHGQEAMVRWLGLVDEVVLAQSYHHIEHFLASYFYHFYRYLTFFFWSV